MKIIENVLVADYHKDLCDYILSSYMPWHFNDNTADKDQLFQFIHSVVQDNQICSSNQNYMSLVANILTAAGVKNPCINRVKFNLLPRQPYTEEDLENSIHQDGTAGDLNSLIYYPHDCDGDTVIYGADGALMNITPKANTAVMFDSQLKHRATPPTINQKRIVLNIVYYK